MPSGDAITRIVGVQQYAVESWWRTRGWMVLFLKRRKPGFRCPGCGQKYFWYHDRRDRYIRDLNVGRYRTMLVVPHHRIDCDRCGRQKERLGFVRENGRCTRRFEAWMFALTRYMTVKAVARLLQVDWRRVKDAEVRHIRGLLRKRDLSGIRRVGIDEVSERRGHRYLTLVTDLDRRRVIWVGRNRDRAVLKRFFRWFGEERTRRLKVAVIDMHDPYETELLAQAPKVAIVYDRFHVMKLLNQAVDTIRRRIQNRATPAERKVIKNKRYLLLRASEDLQKNDRVRLKELLVANEEISTAYLLKEELREWFGCRHASEARRYLRDWIAKVRESGIAELLKFVRTLEVRRRGLRNYFRHRATNGLSEGFNNVVGTIKKMAYGFHDWHYFRLKILRMCGKLEPED
jgi:transposase